MEYLFSCRLNFSTAFSSNAVAICNSIGLSKVKRLEVSTRFLIHWEQDGLAISPEVEEEVCIAHNINEKITSDSRNGFLIPELCLS
jgi:phosphoribosylformylglycinamidine synthase